jgi:hypothetical protein
METPDYPSKKADNDLVTIVITPGSKFYEGRKHGTHAEIAAVLNEHAKRYEALGGVFLLLAKHIRALRDDTGDHGSEGGSQGFTITVGPCKSCVTADGRTGYTTSIDNVPQPCTYCIPA